MIITFIVSSSSLVLGHNYIKKSLTGLKSYRGKFLYGEQVEQVLSEMDISAIEKYVIIIIIIIK